VQPDGYPTNWQHYDSHVLYVGVDQFGFRPSNGDVNRFGARFRAAAKFQGVLLEGYAQSTVSGYSSLCRVLFIWSAFESFMSICNLEQRTVGPLLDGYGALAVADEIRATDAGNAFYRFIQERVNAAHRTELENYFNQDPCNVAYLASAIRHIFAHGSLTPNANQVEPPTVVAVCNRLCDFLLSVMDREFGNKVAHGLDDLHGR
jgi:hypothetical protein